MTVLLLGSKTLGLRVAERLTALLPPATLHLVTIDDSDDSRSAYTEFRALSDRTGVPLGVARDRAHSESLIGSIAPELCFVVGWYWLIGARCLTSVPNGFIGIHFSQLPRYRGTSPLVWQLINGEPEAWYSFFTLTEGMDEGDLWAQGSVPIGPTDYVGDVLARLEARVVGEIDSLVPAILDGTAASYPQPPLTPSYCAARLPEDGILDFTRPARECYDFVRAQSRPYPGAFAMLDAERLTIWRARHSDTTYYGRPGQVARIARDGVTVICGDHRPLILETVGWRGEEHRASDVIRSVRSRLST
jgi:methionyl-tRNA formyltransferase